jgi:crossover junction endodeoxyribonuclease RusA
MNGPWTLEVPAPADWISLNDRGHWATRARLTKAWRHSAHMYARLAALPKGLGRVHITAAVIKSTARAYDAHNLNPTAKAVIDGLVDYGLTVDDANAYVVGPDMREGGKGRAGLLLTITLIGSSNAP